MCNVTAVREEEARRLRRAWLRGTATVAAGAVAGGFLVGMLVAGRYEARLGRAAREASVLRHAVEVSGAGREIVTLLGDPETRVLPLHGPDGRLRGRLIWNERAGGRLVITGLPAPPPGRTYAVWTLRGGRPSPAGALPADTRAEATLRLPPGPPLEGVLVTLEREAVPAAPAGPRVLVSR